MPGLKSAGGTEEILRNMVGERVLGLPPEPRLDKGIPFSELRAREKEAVAMNFALSDEQEFLKEAARGALARVKTVEAAREALDGGELPDLWPTAVEAGWPGLLVSEANGGAELAPLEAMLVFEELGRVLAGVPLLGHLPATFLLDRGGAADGRGRCAAGERAPRSCPARPPATSTRAGPSSPRRARAARRRPRCDGDGRVTGTVAWVPDAPGAEHLVVVLDDGRAAHVRAADATVEPATSLRRHALARARHASTARPRRCSSSAPRDAAAAWYIAQALIAAEALGAVDVALEASVAYAQGAPHVRARDRLLPGGQARAGRDAARARQRPLAHVLRGLGGAGQAGRVPARRVGVPARRRQGARPRGARADLRPRRHRRDVGARRAAVLPPRAALAPAARRRPPGPPTASPASCSRRAAEDAAAAGLAAALTWRTSGSSSERGVEPAADHARAVEQARDRGAAARDHRLDARARDVGGLACRGSPGIACACFAAPAIAPNSVWVKPGQRQVTLTPVPPSSACTASENDCTNALLAA